MPSASSWVANYAEWRKPRNSEDSPRLVRAIPRHPVLFRRPDHCPSLVKLDVETTTGCWLDALAISTRFKGCLRVESHVEGVCCGPGLALDPVMSVGTVTAGSNG